jgi:hypothetical protein
VVAQPADDRSENAVAILGIIALAIFAPWAYWIDRHRVSAS